MKRITLFLLISSCLSTIAFAQSHTFVLGCLYSKYGGGEGTKGCAGCTKEWKDKKTAHEEEQKNIREIIAENERKEADRIKKEKAARDLKAKIEAEKRKQKEQAEKDFKDFLSNKEKYFKDSRLEPGNYPGYNPAKARTLIPEKVKGVVLFENKIARQYEIKRGNDIVKTYSWNGYLLKLLNANLPYIIVVDYSRKKNNLSILDNRGELMKIGEEMYFDRIELIPESNTIELIIQLTDKEEMISSMDPGVYRSASHAKAIENFIVMEGEALSAKRKAAGDNTVYIGGIGGWRNGFSAKRIITGLDLSFLENKTVYVVQ